MSGTGRWSSAARTVSCDTSWTLVRFGSVFAGIRCTATVPSATYFPYGDASFESIRQDKQFYVDRTDLIRVVEETGEQVVISRPPRFGKSLHLDTCFWYYDKSVSEEKRNELFEGTDIGANPTPLRGQFIVLKLDLSGIEGSVDQIRQRMTNEINDSVRKVVRVHRLPEWVVNPEDGLSSIRRLADAIDEGFVDAKLMILVDEYDRSANRLLLEDRAAYDAVVGRSSASSPAGPLRALVETFKEISRMLGSRFRSLITGVSPIALHDASGYNVAKSLSLSPKLGDSFAFKIVDVERGLRATLLSEEERASALKRMTEYYDGYRFPGSTEDVYNPQQCIFFLQELIDNPTFRALVTSATASKQDLMKALRDSNVKPSGQPVTLAANCGVGSSVVFELSALTTGESLTGVELRDSFYVRDMLWEHLSNELSWEESRSFLVSYLFYQGACTLSKDGGGFVVPNQLQKADFLDAVAARRATLAFKTAEWFLSLESTSALQEVLQRCVTRLPTAQQGFPEAAFQAAVLSSLQSLPVSAEYTLRNWKRVDLLFQLETEDVVLELKRVSGEFLEAWKALGASRAQPEALFFEADKKALSSIVWSMDEAALLEEECSYPKTVRGRYSVCRIPLRSLLEQALGQARDYATQLSQERRGHDQRVRPLDERPIHYCSAVLVHDRVVALHGQL